MYNRYRAMRALLGQPNTTDQHFVDAIDSLTFVAILIVGVFITNFIQQKKWQKYLPESGAAMLLGIFIGGMIKLLSMANFEHEFIFEPELFYFILLPPIIFESGYNMNKKDFFLNMTSILFYAVFGTILSTLVVGYGLYLVSKAGLLSSIEAQHPLVPLQFGALISATDPVATLSIMGSPELMVDPLLYSLVFGESVLNDAVAIVLFRTLDGFVGKSSFSHADVLDAIGEFFLVSFGSVCIGLGIGLVTAFIFRQIKHLKEHPHLEVALTVLFAYIAYLVAEIAGLSGVMSLFLCGICMKHYVWYSLSEDGKKATHACFKMLAFLAETFVFVYIGMNLFTLSSDLKWDPALIGWSMLFILLGRVANILPLSLLANIRRKNKIPFRMQIMLWFAGLRGAIAFSLSLNIRTESRAVIITTTLFIVLFTTLFLGSLTAPLLRKLKLQQDRTEEEVETETMLLGSLNEDDQDFKPMKIVSELKHQKATAFHRYWRIVDERFMKPMFGGKPREGYQIQ